MARKLSQEKVNEVLRLYYDEHKEKIEIYKATGVSRPTINKYIKADPRYSAEIEWRKQQAKERRKAQWREYQHKRRERAKRELWDETYEIMKKEHFQAVMELSSHRWPSVASMYEFLSSAYVWFRGKFVRKDRLEGGTLVPETLPKYIKPVHTLTEGIKRKRNTVINIANNAIAY